MVISYFPGNIAADVSTEPEKSCEHLELDNWQKVNKTTGLPVTSGSYVLTEDIELSSVWQINDGVDIKLCLNGKSIVQTKSGQRVIYVKGGTLSVYDCIGAGSITGANVTAAGAGVRVDGNGVFNFHGGIIKGNITTGLGAGVYVTKGTLNMYGGEICDNHADSDGGGGIGMNGSAVINIYGGKISSNTAKNGGGIMVQSSNNAVLIKDAEITGNTATVNGGGVYSGGNTQKQVTVGGNLNITGNKAAGKNSNLFIPNNSTQDRSVKQTDLAVSARIGVSVNNNSYSKIVYAGADSNSASCYIPDDSTRYVSYSEGALSLAAIPSGASAHANTPGYEPCNHTEGTWTAWYGQNALPTESGRYFLSYDVNLGGTWTVSAGTSITLCLNGKNITQSQTGACVITVAGGELNICDCTASTENEVYTAGKIGGAKNVTAAGGGIRVENNGIFRLYDGIVSDNETKSNGGGIYVNGAYVYMFGGSIENNSAAGYGGGICTAVNVTAEITGGVIKGNSGLRGGGISVENPGSVLLKDVSITDNTATGYDETNTNHRGGGGVFVNGNKTVTLSGIVKITDNTKNGIPSNLTVGHNRVAIEKNFDSKSVIGVGVYPANNADYTRAVSLESSSNVSCYTADDVDTVAQEDGNILHIIAKPAGYDDTHSGSHENCGHPDGKWIAWGYTDRLPVSAGNYYLTGDVTLGSVWNVNKGYEITLCLNGHKITQKADNTRILSVSEGTVNICDCTAGGSGSSYKAGVISGADVDDNGAILVNGANSRLNLYNGIISGNTAKNGGAIYVDGGASVTVYGGTISGNRAVSNGGGICVNNGSATLDGGLITGNQADNGGGIRTNKNGSFKLVSGEITGNFAMNNGGGIHVGGSLVMSGGSITNNGSKDSALTTSGGAIAVSGGGKAQITGGEIKGNKAKNGGGIVIQGDDPVVLLKDVIISDNTATGIGGGVCASFKNTNDTINSITLGGAVNIKNNTAGSKKSNLFLGNTQMFYISDITAGANVGVSTNGTYPKTLVPSGADISMEGYFVSDLSSRMCFVDESSLILGVTPSAAHTGHTGDDCGHEEVTWIEWMEDNSLPNANGHYYLSGDVKLTNIWNFGDGKEITICLNGHNIIQTAEGKRVLRIGTSTVNICDCTAHGTGSGYTAGKIMTSGGIVDDDAGAMMLTGSGILRIYNAVIEGIHSTGNGVIVVQNGFTLEMYGGMIKGNASDKNGGVAYVTGGGRFILNGGQIRNNSCGENGGAIYVNNGSALLNDGSISYNKAGANGGAVGIGSNGSVSLSGAEITNNTAGKIGGGVIIYNGEMIMSSGKVSNNSTNITRTGNKVTGAKGMGGGIADMGGSFTLTGGQISNNQSAGGAGLYASHRDNSDVNPVVALKGGRIFGNKGTLDGSGVRIEGVGDDNKADLVLDGVEISGNEPFLITDENTQKEVYASAGGGMMTKYCSVSIKGKTKITGNRAANAAGVLFNNSDVTVENVLISSNTGTGNGAGMYSSNSEVTVKGGYIRSNTAAGNGGGMFLSRSIVTLDSGEIYGNSGGMGGGIYNYGSTLLVNGGKVYSNKAVKVGGGGIYSANNESAGVHSSLTIAGGEISKNTSKSDGSGVRADSGSFLMTGGTITENNAGTASAAGLRLVNIKDAKISGGVISKNTGSNASGMYVKDSVLTITDVLITRNRAKGSGAGILSSGATIYFKGGDIKNNYAKGDAGGVFVSGGSLVMSGGKISDNRADKTSSGLLATNKAKITLSGGSVSGNIAKLSCGGIMIQGASSMRMSGGSVKNNTSGNHGGGIYINRKSTLSLRSGVISGNKTGKSGAGIYVGVEGTLNMSGGSVINNKATTFGGGMSVYGDTHISGGKIDRNNSEKEGAGAYISDATLKMTGGEFDSNETQYNGGGLCVRGEKGVFELRDGAVTNNTCKESGGGVLVQGKGTIKMYGGKINKNFAPNGGGGIRLHLCPGEIYGGEINENVSHGAGAGIYSNLSLVIKDAAVCNNKIVNESDIKTRSSAAIRTYNESTLEMENVTVTGNTCDGRAGAVEIAYDVQASIKNCTFENNSSTERGGAFSIYREGNAVIENCTFKDNTTDGNGGTFSLDPYGKITLKDCSITGGKAETAGGFYVATKSRAVFNDCIMTGNTSTVSGSVIYANGDVVLEDTVITENTDLGGKYAVCFDNDGQDTESYLPGVYEIKGNTVISGNNGGDLIMINNAFVNIPGDGLGSESRIAVVTQDEDITRWIIGPYDYESTENGFVVTRGEKSMSTAYRADSEQQDTQSEENISSPAAGLIIGIVSAAMILAVIVVILVKNKKRSAKNN